MIRRLLEWLAFILIVLAVISACALAVCAYPFVLIGQRLFGGKRMKA